jgi:hypothetical protein
MKEKPPCDGKVGFPCYFMLSRMLVLVADTQARIRCHERSHGVFGSYEAEPALERGKAFCLERILLPVLHM